MAERFMTLPEELKGVMLEEQAGLGKQGAMSLRTLTGGSTDFRTVSQALKVLDLEEESVTQRGKASHFVGMADTGNSGEADLRTPSNKAFLTDLLISVACFSPASVSSTAKISSKYRKVLSGCCHSGARTWLANPNPSTSELVLLGDWAPRRWHRSTSALPASTIGSVNPNLARLAGPNSPFPGYCPTNHLLASLPKSPASSLSARTAAVAQAELVPKDLTL